MEAAKKGAYAVRQLHDGAKGRLSIATVTTSDVFLSECLRSFSDRYPDIVVDIDYVSCGDALLDEGEDPYDFHFLYMDMLPDGDEFDTMITHTEPLGIVVPGRTSSCRAYILAVASAAGEIHPGFLKRKIPSCIWRL